MSTEEKTDQDIQEVVQNEPPTAQPQETAQAATPQPVPSAPTNPSAPVKRKSKAPLIVALVVLVLVVLFAVGAFVANNLFQKQITGQIQAQVANALQVDASNVKVDIGDGLALMKMVRGVAPHVEVEAQIPAQDSKNGAEHSAFSDKAHTVTYTMGNYSLRDNTIGYGTFDTTLSPDVLDDGELPFDGKMECTDDGIKFSFNQNGISAEGVIGLKYVIGTDKKGTKAYPAMAIEYKSLKASFMGQTKEATADELAQMSKQVDPVPLVTHLEDKLQVSTLEVTKDGIHFVATCSESVNASDFVQAAQ